MNAIPPDTRHLEADGLVDGLLAEGGGQSVSEFELAHLRRRVRERINVGRKRSLPARLAGAAAAAVVAIAALGLVLTDGAAGYGPGDSLEAATFSRTDDGQVRIEFADGRPVHRIRKQVLAASGPSGIEGAATIRTVTGRVYVDKNGQPRPGTIVMYTVD